MRVVCIEGPHGTGKTTTCRFIESYDYPVLDEMFMNMPKLGLKNQGTFMETFWLVDWFKNVVEFRQKHPDTKVVVTDRSPWSAVAYAPDSDVLELLIMKMMRELREIGIIIETVYLKTSPEILWKRIQDRLLKEPERAKFNEGDRDHMERTLDFYNGRGWHYTVDNDNDHLSSCRSVLKIIKSS